MTPARPSYRVPQKLTLCRGWQRGRAWSRTARLADASRKHSPWSPRDKALRALQSRKRSPLASLGPRIQAPSTAAPRKSSPMGA